jgi:hypothetical protein
MEFGIENFPHKILILFFNTEAQWQRVGGESGVKSWI